MKLLVVGGTGFIGAPLCRVLAQHGHEPLVVTRRPEVHPAQPGVRFLAWDAAEWREALGRVEGVINLAGEPIAAKRWSPRQQRLIRDSRVQTTRAIVDAIAAHARKPGILVNASAIGYYGDRGDDEVVESDRAGRGFLAQTCQAWEAEALRAQALGLRVVRLRIGLVLGPGGGALSKLVPPFCCWIGGPLGSGRQEVSWIHRDDVIGLIEWVLATPDLSGAVNATAPHPVIMREFCATLGRVLHRPSWAPVPAAALRLLLGEMAEMLLTGQRVMPGVALRLGYTFRYAELMPALAACVSS